jgi:hypothetical protein
MVSAISAAIPNPMVTTASVTMTVSKVPVPNPLRPNAAKASSAPTMPTPAIPRGSCTNGIDPRTE